MFVLILRVLLYILLIVACIYCAWGAIKKEAIRDSKKDSIQEVKERSDALAQAAEELKYIDLREITKQRKKVRDVIEEVNDE